MNEELSPEDAKASLGIGTRLLDQILSTPQAEDESFTDAQMGMEGEMEGMGQPEMNIQEGMQGGMEQPPAPDMMGELEAFKEEINSKFDQLSGEIKQILSVISSKEKEDETKEGEGDGEGNGESKAD